MQVHFDFYLETRESHGLVLTENFFQLAFNLNIKQG